jgi:hypothetical protein
LPTPHPTCKQPLSAIPWTQSNHPARVDSDKGNLQSKVFFIWGSFCFVCIAFVYFMIYETKGLTLEEVDGLYESVSKAWLSKNYRPEVRFAEAEKEMQVAAAEGRHMSVAEAMATLKERRRSSVMPAVGANTAAANNAELDGDNEVVGDEKQV